MNENKENDIRRRMDAYLKGALSDAEIQELWEDFAAYPHLLDELETEVHVREAVKQKGRASSERIPYKWVSGIAALIALVALLQFFRVESNTDLNSMLIQEINLANLESANSLRATGTTATSIDSLLNKAFEQALLKNNEEAYAIYASIIEGKNKAGDAQLSKTYLNKGILLFNEGNFESAIMAFRQAEREPANEQRVQEKILWFLSNALLKTGDTEAGVYNLQKVFKLEGVYKDRASLLLKKIEDDQAS